MWHPFAAGAAWAVALWRSAPQAVECQCTCRCEHSPCGEPGVWWEVLKAILLITFGIALQALRLIPFLVQSANRALTRLDFGAEKEGQGASRLVLDANIEERAKEQIRALRSRGRPDGAGIGL